MSVPLKQYLNIYFMTKTVSHTSKFKRARHSSRSAGLSKSAILHQLSYAMRLHHQDACRLGNCAVQQLLASDGSDANSGGIWSYCRQIESPKGDLLLSSTQS